MAERQTTTRAASRASAGGAARSLARGVKVNALAELLADLLEATGLVPEDKLNTARGDAGADGSLVEALMEQRVISSDRVAEVLAEHYQMPLVNLDDGISAEAASRIAPHVLERVVALPFKLTGDKLQVAIADPANVSGIDELKLATSHQIELSVASREQIGEELSKIGRTQDAMNVQNELLEDIEVVSDDEEPDDLEADDGISDAPLVRLVNSVIFQAAEDGASDIHFMPEEDALVVRFRVDGVLQEVQRIPKRMASGVTTRLKVLAKLDIAERRRPQDGRISLNARAAGRMLDIRVAVMPTVEGETVVMRLVDKTKKLPSLEGLGFSEGMAASMLEVLNKPTGALLVTGPTGSGKTTTLYAGLNVIIKPEIHVITVEDPVEYKLRGINQVQINAKAGLTFAQVLRSILRADPDVVMVGEIRDAETAKISIEAAMTGHFVLSTLHTNDAAGALSRLNEMGVEPFLISASISGVLAQRLARKLCSNCAEMYTPAKAELTELNISKSLMAQLDGTGFYRKVGCPRCSQTGYKGRLGVYEFMLMTEELATLAAKKASHEQIKDAAVRGGMMTMWEDGIAKVAQGLTSVEELARVVNS